MKEPGPPFCFFPARISARSAGLSGRRQGPCRTESNHFSFARETCHSKSNPRSAIFYGQRPMHAAGQDANLPALIAGELVGIHCREAVRCSLSIRWASLLPNAVPCPGIQKIRRRHCKAAQQLRLNHFQSIGPEFADKRPPIKGRPRVGPSIRFFVIFLCGCFAYFPAAPFTLTGHEWEAAAICPAPRRPGIFSNAALYAALSAEMMGRR